MISNRARALVHAPSPLVEAHFAAARNPFDAVANPDGYVNMGTAENYLLWDMLGDRLRQCAPLPEPFTHYQELFGSGHFRRRAAAYLQSMVSHPVDPDHLVVMAGCSAVLENLAYALCEPGEGFIVPAPYYTGFEHSLSARPGVRLFRAPLVSKGGFKLTREALEQAKREADAANVRVRALLITSPQNPLGRTLGRDELNTALDFVADHDLDCVFDEIYAQSTFGDGAFVSGKVLGQARPDRLHLIYGFAKDFGLSGFKTGLIWTEHPELLAAMRELSYFSPVSTETQFHLAELLADEAWLASFFEAGRRRLGDAHARFTDGLSALGVTAAPANAGVFVWLDFRAWLERPDAESERALFERMYHQARLNITPGQAFQAPEPGWFRACFAQPEAVLDEAVARLSRLRPFGMAR